LVETLEDNIKKLIKDFLLKKGDRVRITKGKYKNYEGTVLAIGALVIVKMPILPKPLFVVVSRDEIEVV